LTKEIVIIRLTIFSLQDNKLIKIPQKFNLSVIPTTKILIIEQEYKVMNAIFYHGSDTEQGHYVSMCREESSCIEIDNAQIKKKQWPKDAKNIYILFLQKSFNKNIYCIKQHIIKYRCNFT